MSGFQRLSSEDVGFALREIGPADVAQLSAFRAAMFATFAEVDPATLARDDEAFFPEAMARGDAVAWLAEDADGNAVGSCAVSLYRLPPKPASPGGVRAYLSSLWGEPHYRGRGLATRLVGLAADVARRAGASHLTLHATEAGRGLYAALGFTPGNEMLLTLSDPASPSCDGDA